MYVGMVMDSSRARTPSSLCYRPSTISTMTVDDLSKLEGNARTRSCAMLDCLSLIIYKRLPALQAFLSSSQRLYRC